MRLKLLAAYGSGLLVLAVVWAGLEAIEGAEQAQLQVEYGEAVRHQCDRLDVAVFEARLSQVALVLGLTSGKMPRSEPDLPMLAAAKAARERVPTEYAVLSTMVVDTPQQITRVHALAPHLDTLVLALQEGMTVVERAMSAPSEPSLDALAAFLSLFDDERQRESLNAVRTGIVDIAAYEASRLVERRVVLFERQTRARLVLVIGGALAFLLITWIITRIRKSIVTMASAQRTIKAQNEALAKYTRDLESTVAELDQFAYVASHDLKAPLRGISNLAEWLEEDCGEALPPDGREHLRLMRMRVKRMEAMVAGVLAYARAGKEEATVEAVDVEALVKEVVDLVATDAEVTLVGPWPILNVTRAPLQQIWMNLVSNAVKYGRAEPTRPAKVRVSAARVEGQWCFSVSDDGPGIEPRFHDKVFGLFQTLTSDHSDSTGIGLAVVKKLVERQGGVISLRSKPGEGTTFSFTYPTPDVGASRPQTRPRPIWRRRER